MIPYHDITHPKMAQIANYCHRAGLYWRVRIGAARIDFIDRANPKTPLVSFYTSADPDDVLESLRLLTIFR